MGQELKCTARFGGQSFDGKALLETDYLLFRADNLRVKAMLKELKSVDAVKGVLNLLTPEGLLSLDLGFAASKWAIKIKNPPTRTDKLGIKAGDEVTLIGHFEPSFAREIKKAGAKVGSGLPIFYSCQSRSDLENVDHFRAALKETGALWIVYPKGNRKITELDVIATVRAGGLKDIKVVSFSPTHTALKFVIPVADRSKTG